MKPNTDTYMRGNSSWVLLLKILRELVDSRGLIRRGIPAGGNKKNSCQWEVFTFMSEQTQIRYSKKG